MTHETELWVHLPKAEYDALIDERDRLLDAWAYHEAIQPCGEIGVNIGQLIEERQQLLRQVERLQAELADWKRGSDVEAQAGDQARAEIASLRQQLDAVRAVIERTWH